MIKAKNLTKKFDGFLAVDGVDLDIKRGQVQVLLGPNGAGKTTTIRMLSSILKPSNGYASIAGFDVLLEPEKVRRSVGVLTEHHGLYKRMKTEEYLRFFGGLYGLGKKEINIRIQNLLEKYGLNADIEKALGEFSKGMRQKLSLVRALLHNPPVLLFDEPTSAMDPESAFVVRTTIKDLRSEERAILICTHNLLEADELADRVAIIQKGKIIFDSTIKNLKNGMSGESKFMITFNNSLNGLLPELPVGIRLLEKGENSISFAIRDPLRMNPILIRKLSNSGLNVLTFQEIVPSIEEAYLNVLNSNVGEYGAR